MFDRTEERIEELIQRVESLERENSELKVQLAEKDAVIANQSAKIKKLEEQIRKNSQNSSKPPSTDGYKKPHPVSNREKTGRKPGAQVGHKGHGLKMIQPDIIEEVPHIPEKCAGCSHFGQCDKAGMSPVRNEIDVEIHTILRRHYVESYCCALEGGAVISGDFPEDIESSMQYGPGVKTLAVTLNTEGMMSIQRIHDFLSSALGLPICTGTIAAMVHELACRLEDTVAAIFQSLAGSPVNNCDETGFRVEGKLYWLHSVCNAQFTYLSVQEKRGEEGMRAVGFLPQYTGIIVTDCLGAYWKFRQILHAICNAHLLRELKGICENYPEQTWAKDLRILLQEMDHCRNDAIQSGAHALPPERVESFCSRYDMILKEAIEANPIPPRNPGQRGKTPKGKVRSLIDRMVEHRSEILRFLSDFRVPFTNNLAEQSVRMAKVKGKVSGCFRTTSGADDFATIMSFIGSVKKHAINVLSAVANAFKGNSYGVLFPA